MMLDESEQFLQSHFWCSRKQSEVGEYGLSSVTQAAQRDFPQYPRMEEDGAVANVLGETAQTRSPTEEVDPDRRVDQFHAGRFLIRRRGGAFALGTAPCSAAMRCMAAAWISFSSANSMTRVLESTPAARMAAVNSASSMFRVVRMQTSMHVSSALSIGTLRLMPQCHDGGGGRTAGTAAAADRRR